jgi:hypothetical protein
MKEFLYAKKVAGTAKKVASFSVYEKKLCL